jgi:hypothetical protein
MVDIVASGAQIDAVGGRQAQRLRGAAKLGWLASLILDPVFGSNLIPS